MSRFRAVPMPGEDGQLLSAQDVAARCGVSKSSAQRWMADPRSGLPVCRIGGVVRVRSGDLDRWIADRVVVPR